MKLMSRPAQRNKKSAIYQVQMRQIWVVLGVMIFGLVLSYVMADGDRLIAKRFVDWCFDCLYWTVDFYSHRLPHCGC